MRRNSNDSDIILTSNQLKAEDLDKFVEDSSSPQPNTITRMERKFEHYVEQKKQKQLSNNVIILLMIGGATCFTGAYLAFHAQQTLLTIFLGSLGSLITSIIPLVKYGSKDKITPNRFMSPEPKDTDEDHQELMRRAKDVAQKVEAKSPQEGPASTFTRSRSKHWDYESELIQTRLRTPKKRFSENHFRSYPVRRRSLNS